VFFAAVTKKLREDEIVRQVTSSDGPSIIVEAPSSLNWVAVTKFMIKSILGADFDFPRKLAPPKITYHTVLCRLALSPSFLS
jgi:hypothetical protein